MPYQVLDRYDLAITLLVTIGYQLVAFAIAFTLKFDKLTDFAGATNFIFVALLTLLLPLPEEHPNARSIVASILLVAWATRLGLFLLYRILQTGRDTRFDDKRDKFFPFLGFFVFQMLWVWAVSFPVTILNSAAVRRGSGREAFGSGRDIAGVVLFGVGFILETWADLVRMRWRSTREKTGKAICDLGPWKWSRHPNYFGEILIQFGIFTVAISPAANGFVRGQAYRALYASILGPFFLTILLLFVSGLPLQERPNAKKQYEKGDNWPEYQEYLKRTSILLPMPPQIYAHLPVFVKRTIFLELPIYVFDPAKHADNNKPGGDEENGLRQQSAS